MTTEESRLNCRKPLVRQYSRLQAQLCFPSSRVQVAFRFILFHVQTEFNTPSRSSLAPVEVAAK